MPEITRFYGIIIRMFFKPKEHEPPHIHAVYGEHVAVYERRCKKMIPKIKTLTPLSGYRLYVIFDDGKKVIYDVKDDINTIPSYRDLVDICGLFSRVRLDTSRTIVYWNDRIDLPSDTIYEYGECV